LDQQIHRLREQGDFQGAATCALEAYGAELFGFLVHILRNEQDANEVLSQTREDLWVGLHKYQARCAIRTWLYTLARHAAVRFRRSPHRKPGRNVGLSEVDLVVNRARTATPAYLRTDAKDALAAIRDALPEDDRALLVLRVDRAMSWKDIARVFSADDSEEVLRRESACLRKRFQVVKEEIRARAKQAGLLQDDRDEERRGGRESTP